MTDIIQDIQYRTPQEVAARLDVSPSTLRRWADEFGESLSEQATSSQGKSHRRYTEDDITKLLTVKGYMNDGLTYEQVRQRLNAQPSEIVSTSDGNPNAIVSAEEVSMVAMAYLSETIEELRQGQLSVLNSQAANRELMGVLIQDNFNLKEENVRLRERSLEVERKISRLRREEESRTEMLRQEIERKLIEVRELATRNPVTILQSRSGCLGSLFGGGGQIQAISPQDMTPHPPQNITPPPASPPRRQYPAPPGPPE